MKDYFETPEEIPTEVKTVLDSLDSDGCSYSELDNVLGEIELLGWTFDYGLDAVPYDLRPLNE